MRTVIALLASVVVLLLVATAGAESLDWPRWRGPGLDGVSKETGLLRTWPQDGPKLAWKSNGLGGGMSSVAVAGERIYTMGAYRNNGRQDGVGLIALNRADGEILWNTRVGGGGDPNCTPTVDPDANLVFALTKDGDFLCADAKTGDAKWRKNFKQDYSVHLEYSVSSIVRPSSILEGQAKLEVSKS